MCMGREFHREGAAMVKALTPQLSFISLVGLVFAENGYWGLPHWDYKVFRSAEFQVSCSGMSRLGGLRGLSPETQTAGGDTSTAEGLHEPLQMDTSMCRDTCTVA
ncbi:hypothetical protein PFLUV_G00227730 [Perca fluviatilis]|uniref:Uncharacterized protein n=1 Tax=Perca fluviatilis TaxID=8168 RepID=A0A6A5E6B8_PERFL|nr:hypothetical protein PFLUV_G00227730 [Perca fluviatilis]